MFRKFITTWGDVPPIIRISEIEPTEATVITDIQPDGIPPGEYRGNVTICGLVVPAYVKIVDRDET